MTRDEAEVFAERWAAAWNGSDVEAVLEHFEDDVVFTSPTAVEVVGEPTVRGKAALRAYWTAALRRVGAVHFGVRRVLWDPARRELAIIYSSVVGGRIRQVSENLTFGAGGRIVAAEVFHGVTAQVR